MINNQKEDWSLCAQPLDPRKRILLDLSDVRHKGSKHSEVVAALGTSFQRHALVVARDQAVQEAPRLLGDTLSGFGRGVLEAEGRAAVPTEADLSDDALEELGHVELQRR